MTMSFAVLYKNLFFNFMKAFHDFHDQGIQKIYYYQVQKKLLFYPNVLHFVVMDSVDSLWHLKTCLKNKHSKTKLDNCQAGILILVQSSISHLESRRSQMSRIRKFKKDES